MKRNIAILYATMTGNARECAEKTATLLATKAGIPACLHDLAHYDPRSLLDETTVLLPISTWGEGEPPDDAVNFFDYVKGLGPGLDPRRSATCASRSSRWEIPATTTFANAEEISTRRSRNTARHACLIASIMTSISRMRLQNGTKPCSPYCKIPWPLRANAFRDLTPQLRARNGPIGQFSTIAVAFRSKKGKEYLNSWGIVPRGLARYVLSWAALNRLARRGRMAPRNERSRAAA